MSDNDKSIPVSRRGFMATGAASAAAAAATPGASAASALHVDRAFVRIREGQVHYRRIGRIEGKRSGKQPLPLYLAHASPGSSSLYPPMLERLSGQRACFAPDTLGAGDSPAPELAEPEIAYYADSVVRILDALGIEKVDFCGAHTGAHIGAEFALRAPHRVRRLVLDGFSLFPEETKTELLANLPSKTPQADGSHMIWAWNYLYRPNSGRSAEEAHPRVVEVLRNIKTYNLGYRAAFRHDGKNRLPLLKVPVLCMASETDPMSRYLDEAASLVPGSKKALVSPGVQGKAAAIEAFLNA